MNSEKSVSLDISSEENDHHDQDDDTGGTKRSYECTFCKRGFTNAQALGGHMNIHRKDRAKAKQFTIDASPSVNKFNNDDSTALPFVSEIMNQPTKPNYYSLLESQMNFQPPHAFYYEFCNSRSQPLSLNQGLHGANLSLQIGPSHVDDNIHQFRRGNQKTSEVDLELRLGHDPY
ncbi:hypothetical protein AAZX31_20G192300 [Glycine max]|uniref:C2H2-type domain-containing protein n=3 Tax=Glycine subgen. Soja TaxID=1462606 RepID=I1NI61_SOYBN|nr:zinc finger protein 10 [Glycine max]XP_028219993.1 zinc finger protein 10-like [Glycine soja]KAG4910986.1 hypothetical protein JHK87_057102 [Glycine soja]KAG5075657.1 hypothetical protein JHK84_056888 [Glycine max]KAG5078299.1 hypothetical protein JHK82_056994 [Glycine max]KAH1037134.1 hypothetical protein GYH30_056515 [Glycine max]KAH1191758.1 Transcriptional regulator TAC1 [Glycine max]|eukprot:XP_006606927.1 zinc finger protein 10 [Glycine max]